MLKAQCLHAVAVPSRPMVDTENKGVQTDPRPVSPARKPDLFRKVTRQQPVARPAPKVQSPPPAPPAAPRNQDTPGATPTPRSRLDQPKYPVPTRVQPAELRDQAAARIAPSIQLADPVGEDVAQSLPHAADGLPAAHRPTLAPKKQPRMFLDDIKIPTSLFKRRGAAARPASAGASADASADASTADGELPAVPDASEQPSTSLSESEHIAQAPNQRVLQKAGPEQGDAASGKQNPGLPMPKLATVQNTGTSKAPGAQTARHATGAGSAGAIAKRPAPHAAASASNLGVKAGGLGVPAALGLSGHGTGPKAKAAQQAGSMPVSAFSPAALHEIAATESACSSGEDAAQLGTMLQSGTEPDNGQDTGSNTVVLPLLSPVSTSGDSAAVDQSVADLRGLSPDQPEGVDALENEQAESSSQPGLDSQLESDSLAEDEEVLMAVSEQFESDFLPEADPAVPYGAARHHVQRTVQRRIQHHRAAPQQPSALQPQISAIHGTAPESDSVSAAAATDSQRQLRAANATTGTKAQRTQHGSRNQKVPSLNLEIMRHLKQQISGLVPLDSRGSPKLSQTASARTPFPSQRTAKTDTTAVASSIMASTARSSDQSRLLSVYPFRDLTQPQADDAASVSTEAPVGPRWPSKAALSLDATVQLITDIYDSKSVADIAALRQQAQCKPMRAFVQQYMQRRFGTALGAGWQQAWQQLQAAVLSHASDDRVASFGVTCYLLASPADSPAVAGLVASSAQVSRSCLLLYNASYG